MLYFDKNSRERQEGQGRKRGWHAAKSSGWNETRTTAVTTVVHALPSESSQYWAFIEIVLNSVINVEVINLIIKYVLTQWDQAHATKWIISYHLHSFLSSIDRGSCPASHAGHIQLSQSQIYQKYLIRPIIYNACSRFCIRPSVWKFTEYFSVCVYWFLSRRWSYMNMLKHSFPVS